MAYALLGLGFVILLVVVAAGIEAYLRGNTRRTQVRHRTTNLLQHAPEPRLRREQAQN